MNNIGISFEKFQSTNKGFLCIKDISSLKFETFDQSTIKIYFDSFKNSKIFVLDSLHFYRTFCFLGKKYLSELNIFDCKLFLNTYQNQLNIDLLQIAKEKYKINALYEYQKIEQIWKIQKSKNWKNIPFAIQKVFLEKISNISFKAGNDFLKIYENEFDFKQKQYMIRMSEFLLSLVFLEQNGIYSSDKILKNPQYVYDNVVTGRLMNFEPENFQVKSKKSFFEEYPSRFGKDGSILIADWKSIDFNVACAISKEKILYEQDVYKSFAKEILNKDIISENERSKYKNILLQLLYGDHKSSPHLKILLKKYPNLFEFKNTFLSQNNDKTKYIVSWFGKRRFFDKDEKNRDFKFLNSLIQMTVADLCKFGVIEIIKIFEEKKFKSVPIPYIVYDGFGFDIYNTELEEIKEIIYTTLINNTIPTEFRQYVNFDISFTINNNEKK